jgi:hypothetical protein
MLNGLHRELTEGTTVSGGERKRVSGQSRGESGSRSQNDYGLT